MPENDPGLQMESSEIYSFFKIGTRIRTSIYPAVLVLCSVNLAFSQSLFEKLEDTLLYHFIKEAKQCSFPLFLASNSQGQTSPLSLFDSLAFLARSSEMLQEEKLFEPPASHNIQ